MRIYLQLFALFCWFGGATVYLFGGLSWNDYAIVMIVGAVAFVVSGLFRKI